MADSTTPAADDPDRERILDLVAEAMEVFDQEGEAGLERFCANLDADRAPVLARLKTLRSIGLWRDGATPALEVPEQLGDFRLLERIGSGGMGVVYHARQLSIERDVALKLIRPDQLLFPGVRERFRREIAIVARLQHEGIVRLFSFGEDRGIPWFAMERIDGASLADVMQRCQGKRPRDLTGADFARAVGSTLPNLELFAGSWLDVCLRVLERGALAVAAAHGEGVLHRDLKPSNVMVTPAGRVVLLDFGLAWSNTADRLTRSGAPLGTVNYMAPEQLAASGASLDERVDVYALGVVLRELLTLRPAFPGTSFETVAQSVQMGRPAPFDRAASAANRDAEIVCGMAMDRDRERRHPGATTLARDLRNVLEQRPILATPPSLGLRLRRFAERHRTLTATAAVAVIALLATPLLIAWRERSLRVALQTTNTELAAQVARADKNLELAADVLNQTLSRLDDEKITWVPDLKSFSDGVLLDTSAFLDALLASNPEDPAGRLRLAATLRKAGHLRWQFFDLPRTAAVFQRTLELLEGCDADPDTVDEIALDVRLALVYVRKLDAKTAAAEYRDMLAQVARHGPFATRPPRLQHHLLRALVRAGDLAMRAKDPAAATTFLVDAQQLGNALATQHASIVNWVEAAKAAAAAEDLAKQQGDADGRRRSRAECDAATQCAMALPCTDNEERLVLVNWLVTRNFRLAGDGDVAAALSAAEAADALLLWFTDHLPTRIEHLRRWAENRERLARNLVTLQQPDRATTILQESLARLDPATKIWPRTSSLLRARVATRLLLVEFARDRGDGTAFHSAIVAAKADALNALAADCRGSTVTWVCSTVLTTAARHELAAGEPNTALATIERAAAARVLADEQGVADKMRLSPDTDLRLAHAEILLHAGRLDDACAVLEALDKRLPRDLEQQVPALTRHRDRPRAAALLQKASAGG